MTSELSLVATGKGSNIMCGDQSDHVLQHWTVDISIDEHEGLTRAKARLRWREKELVGVGLARLNPADHNVPEIGDELSVARALSDLGKANVEGVDPRHRSCYPSAGAIVVLRVPAR